MTLLRSTLWGALFLGLLSAGAVGYVTYADSLPSKGAVGGAQSAQDASRGFMGNAAPDAVPSAPPPAAPAIAPAMSELDGAWGRFQTGDYEGAIVLLRKEFALRPADAELQANLATALFALALVKVKAQQFADAEKLLDESAKLGNRDAARTLASLKLKLGAVDLASGLFEDLVDSAGALATDSASLKVLVDVSLRSDDLDRADWFLDKLPEADPFVAPRRRRLAQKRAFAKTQETVERGGIVEVALAEGLPRALADSVARAMEEAHAELAAQLLGGMPQPSRLKAFLYPHEAFQAHTDAPPWAGGLFDGLISIPVPRPREGAPASTSTFLFKGIAKVARHETTHAYLYAFCGDLVPAWLGEGLAQRMEGRDPSQSIVELQKQGGLGGVSGRPVSPSLDRPFTEASSRDASRLYAQSFLLVNHYTRLHGGMGFWRGVLQRACLARESFPAVIAAELSLENSEEGVATSLWRRDGAKAMEAR